MAKVSPQVLLLSDRSPTIQAYPGGGGCYTVARQSVGVSAGLLDAAAPDDRLFITGLSQLRTFFGFFVLIFIVKRCVFSVAL
jgi:hypothetical protein